MLFLKKCIFYRTKSDLKTFGHPTEHSFILSDQIRTAADGRKKLFRYARAMGAPDEEDDQKREKKRKPGLERPARKKKKVLKVGGLWVDPASFPSFVDEKDADPTKRT